MDKNLNTEPESASQVDAIVIGHSEQGQLERLIDLMVTESAITTGSYFSMYFAKSRKAWVVHYGQVGKVEAGSLYTALSTALEELIENRNTSNGHQFTLYD